jgi:hypothetical protein
MYRNEFSPNPTHNRGFPALFSSRSSGPPVAKHRIRLHGPWKYQAMARTVLAADGSTQPVDDADLPPAGHIEVPADWGGTLGEDFFGQVLFTRHFGRPTGLEAQDRVLLVIERVDAFGTVALNGLPIGIVPAGGAAARFDIGDSLRPRNQLAILVELPQTTFASPPLDRAGRDGLPGGLVGAIGLEIV